MLPRPIDCIPLGFDRHDMARYMFARALSLSLALSFCYHAYERYHGGVLAGPFWRLSAHTTTILVCSAINSKMIPVAEFHSIEQKGSFSVLDGEGQA